MTARRAVEKTRRGKVKPPTFPPRLQIPQNPRDSHFPTAPTTTEEELKSKSFITYVKGDTSNVVTRGTFLLSVDSRDWAGLTCTPYGVNSPASTCFFKRNVSKGSAANQHGSFAPPCPITSGNDLIPYGYNERCKNRFPRRGFTQNKPKPDELSLCQEAKSRRKSKFQLLRHQSTKRMFA